MNSQRGEMVDMKKFIPLAILTLLIVPAYVVAARSDTGSGPKPSIVLVHGAWLTDQAGAASLSVFKNRVHGLRASNPLRSLTSDAAYIASFLQSISGPIILVGHSYGGAVITNAAVGNPNVKALVYVDASHLTRMNRCYNSWYTATSWPAATCLGPDPTQVFNFVPYPGAPLATLMCISSQPSFHHASQTSCRSTKQLS